MDNRQDRRCALTLPIALVVTMALAALVNFIGLSRAGVLTAYVIVGNSGLATLLLITLHPQRHRR